MKTNHRLAVIFIISLFSLSNAIATEIYYKVRIEIEGKNPENLYKLGLAIPTAMQKKGEWVQAELSESDLNLLSEAGFSYEILIRDMSSYYQQRNAGFNINDINAAMRLNKGNNTPYATPENFMLGSMGGYHTYAEILDDLDAMKAIFPELITQRSPIGTDLTIEGRPIEWVRISNDPENIQDKPRVLYTALTHAREPVSMQQMLFQMWYLLENYESDPEIKYLIDNTEMYFVPCANPDGYIYCQTTHPNGGSMHRKNKRINADGSIGVDLNRNFGYQWGYDNLGSSPTPSSPTYRGTGPFSEPESQIMKQFAETYNFSLALNNHTYSDLLIYPWGYNNELTPDGDIFIEYARLMTRENNYAYGTVYETLNYTANGGTDDWYYGEQETKEKTFAFTPEAGKPSDGFWPAVSRIEEICASHTHMNISLARLALSFAEVRDLADPYISNKNAEISMEIINLGQQVPANYTISLIPVSENIVSTGQPITISNMEVLQTENFSVIIELLPNLPVGAEIKYVVSLNNGSFSWNDTITKYYGEPVLVFSDPADNLNQWNTINWGIDTEYFNSSPSSIAESPGQEYANNTNTMIILQDPIDLSQSTVAWVEFFTWFDIETNWDYAQFMYSIDGKQSWVPLEGLHTKTGSINQDTDQPLYHGKTNDWIKEDVNLSHLAGEQEVWLQFRFVSDGLVTGDGFYFDDFVVKSLQEESAFQLLLPEKISFYQHQQETINFAEMASWQLEGDVEITWDETDRFNVSVSDETIVTISNHDPSWAGSSNLSFTLTDDLVTIGQELEINVLPVSDPAITGQQNITILQGEILPFETDYIFVDDEFFSYPVGFSVKLKQGPFHRIINDIDIQPDPSYAGILSVPMSVNNGFADSDYFNFQIVISPATTVERLDTKDVEIYYNAWEKTLILTSQDDFQDKNVVVSFIDVTGRIIKQKKLTGSGKLNLDELPAGFYVVWLEGDFSLRKKMVIE